MKKILLSFIVLFGFMFNVKASVIGYETLLYGGSSCDQFQDVVATQDGGYVAVGITNSTDITGLSITSQSGVIVKYDNTGKIEWQRSYEGNGEEAFYGIDLTSDGGFIVAGFSGSNNLSVTNLGEYDAIIVKYDSDGNIEWSKNYGGPSNDYYYDVTSTSDGGYIVVGYTYSSIDEIDYYGYADAIIVKYDSNGNIEWQKSFGGYSYDYFYKVIETEDGDFVTVGYTYSSISNLTYYGSVDAIIVKYDNEGNIIWQESYGGSGSDYFYDVIQFDDKYLVVGQSNSTEIDGITSSNGYDGIIVSFDKTGNIVDEIIYGGNGTERLSSIISMTDNSFVVSGSTRSTDIDDIINVGLADAVVVKYDSSGNILWNYSTGGTDNDVIYGAAQLTNTDIVLVGMTYSDDIENTTYNGGDYDALIMKLNLTYDIDTKTDGNGTIEVSSETAYYSDLITFTITAKSGYTLSTLTLTASDGSSVTYELSDETYTFTVAQDTVIEATFSEIVEDVVEVDTTTTEQITEEVEETNPNTGSFIPLALIPLSVIGIAFINKKQIISKI